MDRCSYSSCGVILTYLDVQAALVKANLVPTLEGLIYA